MIILEPIMHKGSHCIAIRGSYSSKVSVEIKKFPGLLYSATQGCFYLIYSPDVLSRLRGVVGEMDTFEEKNFEKYLAPGADLELPKELVLVPEEYRGHLIKRRYSRATCDNYLAQFNLFLKFIHPAQPEEINDQHIHDYQLYLIERRGVSHSTQNQAINSIKFYLEQVKKGPRREYYIERPRKESKLPTVLSEEEMTSLLSQTNYIKHKCLLNAVQFRIADE